MTTFTFTVVRTIIKTLQINGELLHTARRQVKIS